MIVCVQGLWHLGSVTAACLAAAGHRVIAIDHDPEIVAMHRRHEAPIAEPGLDELLATHARNIEIATDPARVASAEIVWVTYDTPVDANDHADVELVVAQIARLIPHLRSDALVMVSSQVPVGTTARLEAMVATSRPRTQIEFAYSPENLRLGKAIQVFTQPDRVVVGVRNESSRARIAELLAPITTKIEWMSIESAEMTKHAINAFLALSVTFANELASVCEVVGADAKQVERGLKTEARIGPRAYLGPGGAFSGGTLARDVAFLVALGSDHHLSLPVLEGVRPSNEAHKHWARRRLLECLGSLEGRKVAVWGLTYKPGTDTLRRSAAVELCLELVRHGALVHAWDPAVHTLPPELEGKLTLDQTPVEAVRGAAGLVIATEWPDFRQIELEGILAVMHHRLILDATRFLVDRVTNLDAEYYAVGVPRHD